MWWESGQLPTRPHSPSLPCTPVDGGVLNTCVLSASSQHLSIPAMVKPLVIVLEALRVLVCLSPLNSIKWTQCDLDQRIVLYRL